jgi:hypothetical protein
MARLHVEGWAPEYGASVEPEEALAAAEGSVDVSIEDRDWLPVAGRDDGIPVVAFVDGVRRIDARLLLDAESGPVAGLCGSYGVGAAVWDRRVPVSTIERRLVERIAVLGSGQTPELPELAHGIEYRATSVADDDPASLVRAFHDAMRRAEAALAEDLAGSGYFVVADGPLYEYTEVPKMGYVKSHRRSYLPDTHVAIIGELPAAHRTPLFTIGVAGFRRYSWYVRLADRAGSHSWAAIARCEASGALDLKSVITIADRSAAVLPVVGSAPQHDPRAPQNLVPIAGLERDLRHHLGDPGLVIRALRSGLGAAA